MIISHNMMALNAMRQYNIVTDGKKKNTEKLSSGYKINRAADDAAGLAISEKMRRQVRGLTQASQNVQEGIGFVQTADGALDEIDDMLQRINELSVKAATETLSDDDREKIDSEVQHIKAEMNRVFADTTFNDRKIWDTENQSKKIIGYESKQALKISRNYVYFDINNENSGAMPKNGGASVVADSTGLGFTWTGYDGVTYTTDKISWDDYKNQNYSVKASSLYNDPKFYAADGTTPLIDFDYKISPIEAATEQDIIDTINGLTVTVRSFSPLSARFEDASGNSVSSALVGSVSASLDYATAYKSQISGATDAYSFDQGLDGVIEPSSATGNMTVIPSYSDVATAKTDNTGFEFKFNMAGIGEVAAKSSRISYHSNDGSPEAENIWWKWYTRSNGSRYTSTLYYSTSGDLAGLMDMLTDEGGTPGLLNSSEGGCSKTGGSATLHFDLTAGGSNIGSLEMYLNIKNTDDEASVLDKIKNTFNSSTVLDMYTTDAAEAARDGYTHQGYERTNMINSPVYGATNTLQLQAGAESGQYIRIDYDALSNHVLKINDTNVATAEDAQNAIDEVKYAMQVVNAQRSDFGAFQNRLEHTYKNLDNVVENTAAAESQIRDTDMASAMVKQSLLNILEQAGASMLAQANQTSQGVMTLLG